jgi:cytochrome P450
MAQEHGPDPPGPGTLETVALAVRFRNDPLGGTLWAFERYGDVVCWRFGPRRLYSIFRPEHIQHVLHDNHQNYVKGDLVERTKVLIGDGLFSSEGSTWRRQRRIIQPSFERRRVASLIPLITMATGAMLDEWSRYADRGTAFDLPAAMTGLTLDVIGRAFFGVDLRTEAAAVRDALGVALAYVNRRAMAFFPMPVGVPTPAALRFRRARQTLDGAVTRIIEARRARLDPDAGDLMSLLLSARDPESGEAMSDVEIRDQVLTFVLAGHETTALALTWALYLLALHPDVDARLRDETRRVLADRAPTLEDLAHLPYARMVLDETLRLYPPIWAFVREAIADDRLDGYRIRAGSSVGVIPYVTHRHPSLWDQPDRFDPERFSPAAVATRPRYAYLPFSGGPRQCIGRDFALMEAQLALAMIVRDYRVAVTSPTPIVPDISITLRPRGPFAVTPERASAGG